MKDSIKVLLCGFLMSCSCPLQAQITGYNQGDENYTLTLAFHNVDTVTVVVPHDYKIPDGEKTEIESYVFWDQYQKKPVYIYKTEKELTKRDLSRHIQFYGPFCDFQLSEIKDIPVKQTECGFRFNHEVFTNSTDAFFYINDEATRLYTCRNTTQVRHQYANFAAGYFQLYIFSGDELILSGFCSNNTGRQQINSIRKMQREYFETVKTYHFDFKIAKTICTDSLRNAISEEADKSVETICAALETDTLDLKRMTTYVYKSMTDLQQFLSMSPRMTIHGKSIGSVNHVSTFDMNVFKHELAHTVIGSKVGLQSSFFCEGLAVYTGYFADKNNYSSDLDSTKTHLDLLTADIITGPGYRFYSSPALYPISGVFTRFIVNKIGIAAFKDIYARENMENAFNEKGIPLAELITEFKNAVEADGLRVYEPVQY